MLALSFGKAPNMADQDVNQRDVSPLLTKGEFGRYVRLSDRQVDRIIKGPDGPRVTRLGGRVFIARRDADAWLDSCADKTVAA